MEITESILDIDASPQTVWSILDDLARYPEWNPILPNLKGRTTVGETVSGDLVIEGMPTPPLTPTITRIVAMRELRWLSTFPGENGFTAEHIFILHPKGNGTRFIHKEIFDGPAAGNLAPAIHTLVRAAYDAFDAKLKARAEDYARQRHCLHASIAEHERGADLADDAPRTLTCNCKDNPVELEFSAPIYHVHLCGCSKCWRPDDALFALVGVIPANAPMDIRGRSKLGYVDERQAIRRLKCQQCGTHILGEVHDPDHHFFGVAFIHPELLRPAAQYKPEFAGFVSSLIEGGTCPSIMESVRAQLAECGIAASDAFSTEIMDAISYHGTKA